MQRLLIESIEGRILTGIIIFVVTTLLLGWIIINEPGRMAAFEEQHLGRSIERGAELFASNCSTCHGADARGIAGRAPALNNPQFFGFDPMNAVNAEINIINTQIAGFEAERTQLLAELGEGPEADRLTEITTRLEEIDAILDAEDGPRARLAVLQEERDATLLQLEDAIIAGYLPKYESEILVLDPSEPDYDETLDLFLANNIARTTQVGWGGTLHSYVVTTLVHGRPGSNNIWPEPMATWSQVAGGPLRTDQINDIANYIVNFDKGDNWTVEDFLAVQQYAILIAEDTGEVGEPVAVVSSEFDRTDAATITTAIEGATGDPVRGEALYTGGERTEARSRLGCSSCHVNAAQGPDVVGTFPRVEAERLTLPEFDGYTAADYVVESIVNPDAYTVDGYSSGVMIQTYADDMTIQDLADIVAYLQSQ